MDQMNKPVPNSPIGPLPIIYWQTTRFNCTQSLIIDKTND